MSRDAQVTATFPSLEWFQAIRDIVNSDEGYRRIGTCDALVGIKVPDLRRYYLIAFRGFRCSQVREASEEEVEAADFWLEMPYRRWKEMIENIKENGKADLQHTLSTIDLEDSQGFARSRDGYKRDLFYRFNRSLQYFFDASARIDTRFA